MDSRLRGNDSDEVEMTVNVMNAVTEPRPSGSVTTYSVIQSLCLKTNVAGIVAGAVTLPDGRGSVGMTR
jgi:hypothetical protein